MQINTENGIEILLRNKAISFSSVLGGLKKRPNKHTVSGNFPKQSLCSDFLSCFSLQFSSHLFIQTLTASWSNYYKTTVKHLVTFPLTFIFL